jgi:hypothetical protein
MEQYKNSDGTYTSPRNGKVYKSLKAFLAHWHYAGTTDPKAFAQRLYKVKCQHCDQDVLINNRNRHEEGCFMNPLNLTLCKSCGSPIKNFKSSKGTCSRSCANTFFRSGEGNGNWGGGNYIAICFQHHEKKCIKCNEEKIVAVHHNDHNHDNNDPANLIPLCPTHHSYVHSRYKDEIQPIIDKFVEEYKLRLG